MKVSNPIPCEKISHYVDRILVIENALVTTQYGVSWQIVPTILPKLLSDPAKAQKVLQAYMQMKKFEIEKLQNA